LAEQTAKATGEIASRYQASRRRHQESVNAIKEISGTIERLSEISSTIAAAVEEQARRRRRFPQRAAGRPRHPAGLPNITDVQRGASETGSPPRRCFRGAIAVR